MDLFEAGIYASKPGVVRYPRQKKRSLHIIKSRDENCGAIEELGIADRYWK
jgi:hypothetical protein